MFESLSESEDNSGNGSKDDGVLWFDNAHTVCSPHSGVRKDEEFVWIQPDPRMSDAMSDTSTDSEGWWLH